MRTTWMRDNLFLLLKAACHQVTTRGAARATDRVGVHGAQALALLALQEQPGCTVTQLADILGLRMSAAATLVQRLVRDGLVQRAPSERDGRAVLLHLSAEGKNAAEGAAALIDDFAQLLRRGFDDDELAVVERFLNHALEAL
ncbi:MAG: MarR family transcriptional regulator [Myxococcales bacterium]|nr:MarR family transcriptional regulator [Myxococcales bacterium]